MKRKLGDEILPIPAHLPVIDPHCHFWRFNPRYYPWLHQNEHVLLGNLTALQCDILPEHYLAATGGRLALKKWLAVEASALPYAQQEVTFLVELGQRAAQLSGCIAGVALEKPDVVEQLDYYRDHQQVKGVRQLLNWHRSRCYRAVSHNHYLTDPTWQRGYRLLAKYGLVFAMQVMPGQLSQVVEVATRYPEVRMVLTHAGSPLISEWESWRQGMAQLAACPHVSVQLSGFGMFDHHWSVASIQPWVMYLLGCFGLDRCFFASNYPVDNLYCSLIDLMDRYHTVVATLSWQEKVKLFAANAEQLYQI